MLNKLEGFIYSEGIGKLNKGVGTGRDLVLYHGKEEVDPENWTVV